MSNAAVCALTRTLVSEPYDMRGRGAPRAHIEAVARAHAAVWGERTRRMVQGARCVVGEHTYEIVGALPHMDAVDLRCLDTGRLRRVSWSCPVLV
jgi:hypothetical protein